MAEVKRSNSTPERAARWYRNLNIGAAVVELAGVAIFPEAAPVLLPLIALNIAQAGLAEVVRRGAAGRRLKPRTA